MIAVRTLYVRRDNAVCAMDAIKSLGERRVDAVGKL